MSFLLDTDTCSAHLRGEKRVYRRIMQYGGRLFVSTATVAEIKSWLFRSRTPRRFVATFADFLADATALPIDLEIADVAGQLGASLRDKGRSFDFGDLLIAATALVNDHTVVTHNTRDYRVFPGLRMCDWLAE
ncbi:MAG: type II toxin-antitoxin system VapC family toxin [Pirellulales bacterium]